MASLIDKITNGNYNECASFESGQVVFYGWDKSPNLSMKGGVSDAL